MIDINEKELASAVASGLVLVDFWAPWCGTCRMLMPVVEEIEKLFGEKLKVFKANIDEHPENVKKFSVSTVPTLLLFKNGEIVGREEGFRLKVYLAKMIEKFL